MEFSVKKFDLLDELSLTKALSSERPRSRSYRIYFSRPKEADLASTATDLELSIRTSCEAKVKKEGAGTLPPKKLNACVGHKSSVSEVFVRCLSYIGASLADGFRAS